MAKSKTRKKNKSVNPAKNNISKKKTDLKEINSVSVQENKEDDIEQEPAPHKVEQVKEKFHKTIMRKPLNSLKSIVLFWTGQFKKITLGQAFFLIVSIAIIFAFVVPPVWSAIDFYRSGMWKLFG